MTGHPYPGAQFWLAGVGSRRKLLFNEQGLFDARSSECLCAWPGAELKFLTSEIGVEVAGRDFSVRAWENEAGVWLQDANDLHQLTSDPSGTTPVRFPVFQGHPFAAMLRQLAHEIAVNIVDGLPLPNLWVYDRPWHRDAAMMALVLEKTGNLSLLESWVSGVTDPFDRNNSGHREPDNLGQMLVILALLEQPKHPLRDTILGCIPEFGQADYIEGLSDYAPRPVYQTKWLKWGLGKLGLDDPYQIPAVQDEYSSLFWMDYRDQHVLVPRFKTEYGALYPYLAWAQAHFYNEAPPLHLAAEVGTWPLTWEAKASEADYEQLGTLLPQLSRLGCAAPHTWHGAEMFLYLHELEAGHQTHQSNAGIC